MSDELTMLRSFADDLERGVPPIDLTEIRERAASPKITFVEASPSRHRVLAISVAALVLAAIAGLVVVGSSSDRTDLQPVDTPAPATTDAAPTSISAVTPTTGAPTTTVPATTTPPSAAESRAALRELQAARNDKLRTLPGITGTAIQHSTSSVNGTPVETTRETAFTMLADGSSWSTTSDGGWGSFDPTTGTSLGAYIGADGQMHYQLIEGWTEFSTGLNILLGGDPTRPIPDYGPDAQVQITDARRDGAAVTVVTITATATPRPEESQVETLVVDDEYGLIVESDKQVHVNGVLQSTQTVRITGLSTATTLPDAFPGEFPDGAFIERSGDPAAFQPVTIQEAAAWFGPGFIGPPEAAGATILLTETPLVDETGVAYGTRKVVEITTRQGFVQSARLFISESRLLPGAAPPAGQIVVDGRLCVADTTSDGCMPWAEQGTTIEAGALAGVEYFATAPDDSSDTVNVTVQHNGLEVSVITAQQDEVEPLLNGLIAW